MSACTFLASDAPLKEVTPSQDYPLAINIDEGTICDGSADDNFSLCAFQDVEDYTDKKYAVSLEWRYTEGRAKRIVEYIKTALQETDTIELWHVWLMGYYEFEDRPFVHRRTVGIDALTAETIRQIEAAEIWNVPDKQYPERPSFYCVTITRL